MKHSQFLRAVALLAATTAFSSCKQEAVTPTPGGSGDPAGQPTIANTPSTTIPDEMAGIWFANGNTGPLTINWDQGTFQGSQGFAEFRTMVFTKDGKDAVEYSSEVFNYGGETQQRLYKLTGTLEYVSRTAPTKLTFHAQKGVMRVYSTNYLGYKESFITLADLQKYTSILLDAQATSFPTTTNYLNAQRTTGGTSYAVKYQKASGTTPPNPGGLYTAPPATGTYVQIRNLYYPTVTIGTLEWMAVNYAGPGGITDSNKPQYGTFFKYADLSAITIPAGWRLPSRQDYEDLLATQGLQLDMWGSTDPTDLASKRKVGQLQAPSVWSKQDGFATNTSGFTALPANLRVTNGSPNGEGTRGLWWTSDRDANTDPLAFQIVQLPSDTYASIYAWPVGFNPPHLPVRLVRNK
jgi:uncharacterized protein (TIGR02145 family)